MRRRSRTGTGGGRSSGARPLAALTGAAALLAVSACGSASAASDAGSAASAPAHQTVTVMARSVPAVGTVLVTSTGYTLYVFAPDNHHMVTCTGVCAGSWPPLMLPAEAAVAAGPGVQQSLLGSASDPAGGRVVTYAGWPLYEYSGDTGPRQANGQDINLNDGWWYVIRPSGQPLIPAS
jgi:predicted lipoprotein with Yx(FWY)xxD motif